MSELSHPSSGKDSKAVVIWLGVVAMMIFSIIVVGGITRLTGSGLSIVEWQPVAGILPPLDEAAWLELFEKYKATPQYINVNSGMSLEGFKEIFFWEYWHRILGRLIGLAFAIPLAVLLIRRNLSRKMSTKLIILLLLGGAQGLLGWFMVKSGLVNNPQVSHYRLAAHLGLAFFVLSAIVWQIMDVWSARKYPAATTASRGYLLSRFSKVLLGIIAFQVVWGAFTAGLRAGYGYNTFPDMNGFLIPPGMFALNGFWENISANNVTVQFILRLGAWVLLTGSCFFWWSSRSKSLSWGQRVATNLFVVAVVAQFLLGVATILSVVNINLAVGHQGLGAVVTVLGTVLVYQFRSRRA